MKVVFIFAHPDDESLSSGGTIAKLTKQDIDVKIITTTRGEAGSLGDPPICTKDELGKVREKELRRAAKILGVSKVFFLDFIDGTLEKVPVKKLKGEFLTIIKKTQPDVVVTFNKEGGSRHPDHIQVSKSATAAFKEYMRNVNKHVRLYHSAIPKRLLRIFDEKGLGYNVFGKIKGTPQSKITTAVDIKDTLQTKIKALKCHQTQHKDWERYLKRLKVVDLNHEFFQLILENGLI